MSREMLPVILRALLGIMRDWGSLLGIRKDKRNKQRLHGSGYRRHEVEETTQSPGLVV